MEFDLDGIENKQFQKNPLQKPSSKQIIMGLDERASSINGVRHVLHGFLENHLNHVHLDASTAEF